MFDINKNKSSGIVEELKKKAVEWIINYSKQKINESKYEIAKYLESQIEKKVKNEIQKQIRKYSFLLSALILFVLGGLFLLYSVFELIFYLLNIPSVFLNLSYSLFIIIIGLVLYLNVD